MTRLSGRRTVENEKAVSVGNREMARDIADIFNAEAGGARVCDARLKKRTTDDPAAAKNVWIDANPVVERGAE